MDRKELQPPYPGQNCGDCVDFAGSYYGSEWCSKFRKWDGKTPRREIIGNSKHFTYC
jgi:hypothetical protein